MDETFIKVQGQWVYLYRAVDKAGQTVDFFLSWRVKVRSSQYLNNLVEQDHRRVKQRIRPCWDSGDSTTRL
jgi:putative transposase